MVRLDRGLLSPYSIDRRPNPNELKAYGDESGCHYRREIMKASNCDTVRCIFITVPTGEQIRQIIEMYQMQGWWQSRDDGRDRLIPRLIAGSHCFVIAMDGETIAGMGRAISDGVSDAYIQDLTVRPNHRDQGIGRKILRALLQRLHADGISWIGLIAEPGSCGLYRHNGFREMPGSVPMLMSEEP